MNVKLIQGIGKTYLYIEQKTKNDFYEKCEETQTGREVVLLSIFSHMV